MRGTRTLALLALAALLLLLPRRAHAQAPDRLKVDYAGDSLATLGMLGGTIALSLVPVDPSVHWAREPFAIDEKTRGVFSSRSAHVSDVLVATTVAVPIVFAVGDGTNPQSGRQGIVYAESIATSLFLNATVKYIVQRPRPATYSTDGRVVHLAENEGSDAHLSFYSGHSSTAFAAAVAGSYLYGSEGASASSRMALWGVEMTLASATANMRVRAGKHFPSDVVVGALVGSAVGVLVPRLHSEEKSVGAPTPLEWTAIGGGLVLGTTLSWVLPINDARTSLDGRVAHAQLVPLPTAGGGSLAIVGAF